MEKRASITDIVRRFFEKNSKQPIPADLKEFLKFRYLDVGAIDSLGLVAMITEIEENCGIRFSAEDLESYEFQSLGGLIEIIQRRSEN